MSVGRQLVRVNSFYEIISPGAVLAEVAMVSVSS